MVELEASLPRTLPQFTVSRCPISLILAAWETGQPPEPDQTVPERKSVPPGIKHEFLYGQGCTLDATEHVILPSVPRLDARTV